MAPKRGGGGAAAAHEAPHFEFFGPYGPIGIIASLPAAAYGLAYACNAAGTPSLAPPYLPGFPKGTQLFTWEALAVFCAWFAVVLGLHLVLPGTRAKGVKLPNDKHLSYKLNALYVFLLTYGAIVYFAFVARTLPLGWVYDNFVPLMTAAILFSSALALAVYVASFFGKGKLLAAHGATGYRVYDFWMGRELNPRLWGLDIKEFCELYPGLIGWLVVNLAMAHKQQAALGYVTNSMWLVNGFALFYVVDALWNEAAILTTMDITSDGFGFMLAFGDLAWVPFTYTTQARFLVDYPQDLSLAGVALVLGVQLLGYTIFRGANGQKDAFRRDPTDPAVAHLKTLATKRGTKLIVSGWWGTSRHINYFGDWLMGVAWCLPTGLAGAAAGVPFFYAVYFAVLLIHRDRRDDAACRAKYGADWDKYCSIVKYRIVPYVY